MHWDIKPENFFIAGKIVKLGDFGESKVLENGNITGQHTGKVGTEMYMSPEMIKHKGRGRVPYSYKTDIWGIGMVFSELMCLEYPFDVTNQLERINAIANCQNFWEIPEIYPEVLRNITKLMLSHDPHEWPDGDWICTVLEEFIKENNWTLETLDINIPGFCMICDE